MSHVNPQAVQPKLPDLEKLNPPAQIRAIDLKDTSLTPAMRGLSGVQALEAFLAEARMLNQVRSKALSLAETAANGERLSVSDLATLTPETLKDLSSTQALHLLHGILAQGLGQEAKSTVQNLLETLDYGRKLQPNQLHQLTGPCPCCSGLSIQGRLDIFISISVDLPKAAPMIAHSFVRDSLIDLAKNLKDPELRAKFLDPDISDKDLFEVLRYTTSTKRLSILTGIFSISFSSEKAQEFLADKIDNLLFYTPISDRVELIRRAMTDRDQAGANKFIEQVLRASLTLKELSDTVRGIGEQSLLSRQSAAIAEYIAHVRLTEKVRGIAFPNPLPEKATAEEISRVREQFRQRLLEIRSLSDSDSAISSTTVADGYRKTVESDLADLLADEQKFKDDLSTARVELNIGLELARLEFRYGVNLTTGASDFLGMLRPFFFEENEATMPRWTINEVRDLKTIFSSIPEGQLLFTPMLREIERVAFLGFGVLGARYHEDGKIKIANLAIDLRDLEAVYEGKSSLVIVLTHEIGHGLQIGDGPAGIYLNPEAGLIFGRGEESIDFDEWITLSNWQLLTGDQVRAGDREKGTIFVSGKEYQVGVPVEFDGRWVVMSYMERQNLVMMYDAFSDFSHRDYAKASPWEDIAEAISEYINLPMRLIKDAPEKFMHLEHEFHKYDGDKEIAKAVKESLVYRRTLKKLFEEAERERQRAAEEKKKETPEPKQPESPAMGDILKLDEYRNKAKRRAA